jgi:hypothetical protein
MRDWLLLSFRPSSNKKQPSPQVETHPTITSTMPDSSSVTKDCPKMEDGGVLTGDEAELARMGY